MKKLYLVACLLLCQQFLVAQGDMAMNMRSDTHWAQKVKMDHSLLGVLGQIEKKFSIYFNFDPDLISDKQIDDRITISDDLNETLDRVLKPLGLVYRKLGNGYYVIYLEKRNEIKEDIKSVPDIPKKKRGDTDIGINRRSWVSPLIGRRTDLASLLKFGINISGRVTDSEGEPLIGVNIQVKGTNKGTSTDFEGRFMIEDIDENAVLVVSYIGYQTQEVVVAGKSELHILLVSDSQLLDEVVVTAFGIEREKKALSYSVQELEGESISAVVKF